MPEKIHDLLADVEFKRLTNRLPADAVARFVDGCREYMSTRHLFGGHFRNEPRQSETREAFATLAKRFAALREALQAVDKALGIHGAIYQLAELEKGSPDRHGYPARQVATKRRTGPGFLANGEAFAAWLTENYTRRDGRAGWPQPNAQDAGTRQDVKAFSVIASECFGGPRDAVVARAAAVLLGSEINSETVKKLRSQ